MTRASVAQVIQLNPKASSTRDIGRAFDGSYASPPPVTVPYGWRLESGRAGWTLVHDRHEWGVISWLIAERRAGRSYRELADRLERDHVPAPTGGRSVGRWHTERVRILAQQYAPDLARRGREDRLSELHALTLAELTDDEREELAELEDAARAALEDAADPDW